jgi:hypothetical protein
MKSLDRSLVEKAGYDNGFEIVAQSDSSIISLSSSLHPITVNISDGTHEGAYAIHFSGNLSLTELKKGLNKELFPNGKIEAWNRDILGAVLKRAAELGIALPDGPIRLYNTKLEEYFSKNPEERGTEREQLVKQRIGQDVFRNALVKYWKGCCAITGIDLPEMLKASHIKPWVDCDDSQRLNVYNGFLLSANYDALFDKGLISFDDKGTVMYSPRLSKTQILEVGGDKYKALRWIDERHVSFLEWHRKHIFIILSPHVQL